MKQILLVVLAVAILVSGMTYAAVRQSSKRVVTVASLIEEGDMERIRLAGRVRSGEVTIQSEPSYQARFEVGPAGSDDVQLGSISVVYAQALPDTFRAGRDVILEGAYRGGVFHAETLLTQCPSKYTPPIPGENGHHAGYDS